MNRHWWRTVAITMIFPVCAWAGRPLETDDADPVEKGKVQIEAAVGYVHDGQTHHFDFPLALSYGLIERLEIGVGFGGQLEEREEHDGDRDTESGIGDLELGAKFRFLDQKDFLPAMSLAPTVKFPTADEDRGLGSGEMDYDLTLIVSRSFTDEFAAHFNIGCSWLGDSDDEEFNDVLHYGLAATYAISRQWEPVAEILAETPIQNDEPTLVGVNVGIRWMANESITLDAAVGTKLVNDWPDLTATVGITMVF